MISNSIEIYCADEDSCINAVYGYFTIGSLSEIEQEFIETELYKWAHGDTVRLSDISYVPAECDDAGRTINKGHWYWNTETRIATILGEVSNPKKESEG